MSPSNLTSTIYKRVRILSRILFFGVSYSFVLVLAQAGTSTLTVSDEAHGNNVAGRANAGTLDDSWALGLSNGAHNPNLFSGATGLTGSKSFSDPSGASYTVGWSFAEVDDIGPGKPTATTFIAPTNSTITIGTNSRLQGTAPNPFPAETRISTGFSGPKLNGIELNFSSSPTDIYDFGIFVGDLESRLNNGTDGRVIVFDTTGVIIGDHSIIHTGVSSDGNNVTNYTPVEPLGSPSGGNNNPSKIWGNNTTVFLSVNADVPIGKAIIHVGDDDHTSNNTGSSEQLAFVGFQVASGASAAAELTAQKSVQSFPFGAGTFNIPGSDVVYTFAIENVGSGSSDADSIFLVDPLPSEVTFYNGDMDGGGPAIGPVYMTTTGGAGLTLNTATDVKYSNSAAKPLTLADCSYTPISGYDSNVTHLCLNPKGAFASGVPFPTATLQFRARIN